MNNKKLLDYSFQAFTAINTDFNNRLDAECGRVLKEAGISGKITAKKLTKLGYTIAYTPDGAARVCKDGKPVLDIIYPLPV